LAAAVLAAGLWAIYAVRRQASRRLTGACVSAALAATLACAIPYMIAIGGLTKKKAIDDFVSAPVPADPPLARVALVGHYLPPHKFADRLINAAHPVVGVAMCLFVGAWLVLRLVPAGRLTGPRKWLLRPEPAAAGLMAAATVLFASLLMAMYVNLQYMSHRHVMFVAALLAPLGAAGFVFLEGLIGGILRRCRVPAALVNRLLALSMVAAAVAMTFNTLHPPHGDGPAIRAAAAALAAQVRPGDRVLTDDPRVTYYAHLPGGPLPVKDLDAEQFDRLIAGADYIVVSHQNIGPPAGHVARRLSSPPRRQVCPPPGAKGPQADAVRVYRTGRRTPPN
jgi:hypothetical protein